MKKIAILGMCVLYFTACGGGGSSSSSGPVARLSNGNLPQGFIEYQRYDIVATPASGLSMMCSTARGMMVISKNIVTGTIVSATKVPYVISGTYIPETGTIEGGFAKAEETFAQYSGVIDLEKGFGSWSDEFGCNGTWKAIKSKMVEK